jgi:hypothetical protein
MTKERELLRRALRYFQKTDCVNTLAADIEHFLSTPSDDTRKPITEEEIDEEIATNDDYWLTDLGCFSAGVRFAEKHHGITNESDS